MASSVALPDLLAPLPVPSSAALALLPLAAPSAKWAARVHAAVAAREAGAAALARALVERGEGEALVKYGRAWLATCMIVLTEASAVEPHLALVHSIVAHARATPEFEREAVLPALGKLATCLVRLADALAARAEWPPLLATLETMHALLVLHPAPFAPLVPALRASLLALLSLTGPSARPHALDRPAADVLAALHGTRGRSSLAVNWAGGAREALGGLAAGLSAITADAWVEDPFEPVPPPAVVPQPPVDPMERSAVGLDWLEGWTEVVLALLRVQTNRPLPVPVSALIAAALRCLNLSLDTPTTPYISPQHHARLVAALPRIWTCGALVLAATVDAVGDHVLLHLSNVLETTVSLLEHLPVAMTEPRAQLLSLHARLLRAYHPGALHPDYPARLLKLCLSGLRPLLETRAPAAGAPAPAKRGKKRARGHEESLVSSLEGRRRRGLGEAEADVVVRLLELAALLHPTPRLAPALLSLSVRLHLALHLSLAAASPFAAAIDTARVRAAVEAVLDRAMLLVEGEGGLGRDWKVLVLSTLPAHASSSARYAHLLHPSTPPLHRPLPPLAQLHFFAETDDERALRLELEISASGDGRAQQVQDDDDDADKATDVPVKVARIHPASVGAPDPPPAPVAAPPMSAPAAPLALLTPAPLPALPTAAPSLPAPVETQPEPAGLPLPPAGSFMDVGRSAPTTETSAAASTEVLAVPAADTSDDERIPDLDSGSSDEDMDDD
ncbi:hypothetical protein Q5752_007047 [Cryptotrichosporon argae]